MPSLQQRYFDILISRVGSDRYPSHQLLDRVESSIANGDQLAVYVEMLIANVSASSYPSHQMLERIQRTMLMVAEAR